MPWPRRRVRRRGGSRPGPRACSRSSTTPASSPAGRGRARRPATGARPDQEERRMEFRITEQQRGLQQRARCLAADFATRAAEHDRDASDPLENYAALRAASFYGLNVPAELGGGGVGLLGWSLAAEELAQGCASTALSFNMHLSVVGPMM